MLDDFWDEAPRVLKGIAVLLGGALWFAALIGLGTLEGRAEISNLTELDEINTFQACEVWTQDPQMVLDQLAIEGTYKNVSAVASYCSKVNGSKW